MMSILYREYQTKTLEVSKVVRTMGHYDRIVDDLNKLRGKSLVKKLTLSRLSLIDNKPGQPLQMVIHQKRAKLTHLMLRCFDANADKDVNFNQVQKLWEDVFYCCDDLFSNLLTKKQSSSKIRSQVILRIHQLLLEGFQPLFKERESLIEEAGEKSYEQLVAEYNIQSA